MKEMTYDGLLSGGKMYKEAEMLPCSHHSFVHAKALAYVVNNPFESCERVSIPQDDAVGFKELKSSGVTLASFGSFRASISAVSLAAPRNCTISGGSISCLYNKKCGVLLTSTGKDFVLAEPTNMQVPFQYNNICQTIRIEDNGFASMLCLDAQAEYSDNVYSVKGKLSKADGATSSEYELRYEFFEDSVRIIANGSGTLFLPIVCGYDKEVQLSDKTVSFDNVSVSSNKKIRFMSGYHRDRIFHTTGGFAALPLSIDFDGEPIEVNITVS
jgi:hypothetical protein